MQTESANVHSTKRATTNVRAKSMAIFVQWLLTGMNSIDYSILWTYCVTFFFLLLKYDRMSRAITHIGQRIFISIENGSHCLTSNCVICSAHKNSILSGDESNTWIHTTKTHRNSIANIPNHQKWVIVCWIDRANKWRTKQRIRTICTCRPCSKKNAIALAPLADDSDHHYTLSIAERERSRFTCLKINNRTIIVEIQKLKCPNRNNTCTAHVAHPSFTTCCEILLLSWVNKFNSITQFDNIVSSINYHPTAKKERQRGQQKMGVWKKRRNESKLILSGTYMRQTTSRTEYLRFQVCALSRIIELRIESSCSECWRCDATSPDRFDSCWNWCTPWLRRFLVCVASRSANNGAW